jgi:hypothetical protein
MFEMLLYTNTHEKQAVIFAHTGAYIHFILARELSARRPADEFCVACLDFVIIHIRLGLTKNNLNEKHGAKKKKKCVCAYIL